MFKTLEIFVFCPTLFILHWKISLAFLKFPNSGNLSSYSFCFLFPLLHWSVPSLFLFLCYSLSVPFSLLLHSCITHIVTMWYWLLIVLFCFRRASWFIELKNSFSSFIVICFLNFITLITHLVMTHLLITWLIYSFLKDF